MTLEHREPHALGGETSVENLCLLCRSHNVHAGRRLFGERRCCGSRVAWVLACEAGAPCLRRAAALRSPAAHRTGARELPRGGHPQ